MSPEPRVSILTPAFNHGAYIRDCLDSVLAQDYTNWELFVLDDGSTDDTVEIASSYARSDGRIRIVPQPHRGPTGLRDLYNSGLSLAGGEFIAILEGDDYWPKDKLSHQIGAFDNEACVTYGMCDVVDPAGKHLHTLAPSLRLSPDILNNDPPGQALLALFRQDTFIPAVTAIIRKDALQRIGGFRSGQGMVQVDFSTWCYLSLECRFQYVDEVLGTWRRHSNSITVTKVRTVAETKNVFLKSFHQEMKRSGRSISLIPGETLDRMLESNLDEYRLRANEAHNRLAAGDFENARQLFLQAARASRSAPELLKSLAYFLTSTVHFDVSALPLKRIRYK